MLRGGLIDDGARRVAARERDLRDVRVGDERLADLVAEARHDVHDAGREPGLGEQVRDLERRHRRVLRRLPDERVAGRERGRHLPGREHQRRVPRHYAHDHAERLLEREVEEAGAVDRDHAPLELVREPREVAEPLGQVARLRAHLEDQLAVVGGLDGT